MTSPGRSYYVLAAIIVLAGGVYFAYFIYQGIWAMTESLIRVSAPGESEVALPKPGSYLIFHEYESLAGGRPVRSAPGVSDFRFGLKSKTTGENVKLSPPAGEFTYSFGVYSGYAVLRFSIDQGGVYIFSAWRETGADGPETVFAIGEGMLEKLAVTILGGFVILFISVAASAVITAYTYHKRRKTGMAAESGPRPIHPGR